jgi:hypothetical protein
MTLFVYILLWTECFASPVPRFYIEVLIFNVMESGLEPLGGDWVWRFGVLVPLQGMKCPQSLLC